MSGSMYSFGRKRPRDLDWSRLGRNLYWWRYWRWVRSLF